MLNFKISGLYHRGPEYCKIPYCKIPIAKFPEK